MSVAGFIPGNIYQIDSSSSRKIVAKWTNQATLKNIVLYTTNFNSNELMAFGTTFNYVAGGQKGPLRVAVASNNTLL